MLRWCYLEAGGKSKKVVVEDDDDHDDDNNDDWSEVEIVMMVHGGDMMLNAGYVCVWTLSIF